MSCADALSLSASPPSTYLGAWGWWWGRSNPAEDIYFISFRSPLTSAFTSSLAEVVAGNIELSKDNLRNLRITLARTSCLELLGCFSCYNAGTGKLPLKAPPSHTHHCVGIS
ncbi:hypothetical protein CEXT_535281 [Caerostris extrusa]|uniref:Uncharacterized protein n=1 Tax=Caerostris extrusa TaxID=172846 RepID=A0AAV4WX78_CAEEX|nr:hypothetical protein CEXT_535281 [Caerostris extrusa]